MPGFVIFVRVKTNTQSFSYSVLSGLLLSLGWWKYFTPILFIAWVPLLLAIKQTLEGDRRKKNIRITFLALITFLIWNLCVTWWVYHASAGGAAMAIICNSILMAMVIRLFVFSLNRFEKSVRRFWLLIPFWLGFEYFHSNWDLSWTWLNLGNAFAFHSGWIQWYEFTGVNGGTLWILSVNLMVFYGLQSNSRKAIQISKIILTLILPVIISFGIKQWRSSLLSKPEKVIKALVVQPNIDPYNEKFSTEPATQIENTLKLITPLLDSTIDLVVLPETFLTDDIWEPNYFQNYSVQLLCKGIFSKNPNVAILSGANTGYVYQEGEKISATARQFRNDPHYFDYFNSGLFFENQQSVQSYHKSKLVPGVERMPYPALFKPLEKLAIDMGGTSGSLGTQEERNVFKSSKKPFVCAPVICYESVFGEFVGEYVKKGANLICIITNDGWWGDTPGYRQHLAYGTLRAIEYRKYILRSANTGISCMIDPLGNKYQETAWWKPAAFISEVSINPIKTFYSFTGDLLGKIALCAALLIWTFGIYLRLKTRVISTGK